MKDGLKGVLVGFAVVLTGLFLSSGREPIVVSLIALVSVVVLVSLVNRGFNESKEIFISGFVLGIPETYHFLVQPNYPGLPELSGSVALFFGVAIIARSLLLLLELLDLVPKRLGRLLGV